MGYFDCNAPGTTGYSVATNGVSIFSIHAHRQDDNVGFYKHVGSDFHWIYMPLDEGEYLTEISRRYGLYVYIVAFGLILRHLTLMVSIGANGLAVHHQQRTKRPVWLLYAKDWKTRLPEDLYTFTNTITGLV
jgi:hypothetical protein